MLNAQFRVTSSHPSLSGHFPDNPIVPGVVSLDNIAQGLIRHVPDMQLDGFPQVKFLRPLRADVDAVIAYTAKSDTLYQFNCESEEGLLLSGQIRLRSLTS